MMLRIFFLTSFAAISFAGCKSIESTFLTRDECNTSWQKIEHLRGVPITLKVPTHLKVTIVEKHYLTKNEIGGVPEVTLVKLPVPIRDFQTEFIKTEKIFTVDFKRPAAGTMSMTLDFKDEEQYFEKIQHEVTDETIKDVASLIEKTAGAFTPVSKGVEDLGVQEIQSIVAVQIFEIDSPTFEMDVCSFLHCHLNKSHDAWVAPPGVEGINRVPLNNSHNKSEVILCPECSPCNSQVLEQAVPGTTLNYSIDDTFQNTISADSSSRPIIQPLQESAMRPADDTTIILPVPEYP